MQSMPLPLVCPIMAFEACYNLQGFSDKFRFSFLGHVFPSFSTNSVQQVFWEVSFIQFLKTKNEKVPNIPDTHAISRWFARQMDALNFYEMFSESSTDLTQARPGLMQSHPFCAFFFGWVRWEWVKSDFRYLEGVESDQAMIIFVLSLIYD